MMNPSLPVTEEWQSDPIPTEQTFSSPLRLTPLRKIVLWMLGAYLILNVGFELVRIPPVGPGIPVGELVLAVCLCIISARTLLPIMAKEVWVLPILVWWGLSLSRAVIDARQAGIWAFRDASQAIESLYLIVGFWYASTETSQLYFFRWLRRLLVVAIFYGLLYPVSGTLQTFSPKIAGLGTGATPIFFSEENSAALLLWAACWLLIEPPRNRKSALLRNIFAGLLVAFAIAFAQARTIDLQVLLLGVVLLAIRRKAAAKWGMTLLLGILIIGAVSISGISVKGRLGQQVSLDFLAQHFESISGQGGGQVQGAAEGVPLRISWWRHIIAQLEASPRNMVFGLGYGMPLTTFMGRDAITREPHNSYMSVIGRLGVSGMTMWGLMQIALYVSWWRSFRLARAMGWSVDRNNLILLVIFCLLTLIAALGEAAMEVPFWAIPYYFFFGVALRYGRRMREVAAAQAATA